MSFLDDHPNFEAYKHPKFEMTSVPREVVGAISGLVLRGARKNEVPLKSICHDLAERIPTEPTGNWGRDFLLEDLKELLWQLSKRLPKFMDFLAYFVREYLDDGEREELNDILNDNGFGYELALDKYGQPTWQCRDDRALRTSAIEATTAELPDAFKSTLEHLEQAKENLKRSAQSDRALKDAVRDCMSAMESLLKSLTGKGDIKDATNALRSQGKWGLDTIVKEGLSVWDRLHDAHPDLRHGQAKASAITEEEALYWIDRITAFVRYMSRRNK